MSINVKRIYEKPARSDGYRILVDRLWPRGLAKEKAKVDLWVKEIAPSNELRRWYNHDHDKWEDFKQRYFEELGALEEGAEAVLETILEHVRSGPVTFVFSSREERLNNAFALKEYVEANG
jgi:uncharacterized protein YeaO (DUF488 family)